MEFKSRSKSARDKKTIEKLKLLTEENANNIIIREIYVDVMTKLV